jgi:hypothetical protein
LKNPKATKEQLHQACLWFKESLEQDPTVNTQVTLAACYEKEGKNRSAWGLYSDAASGTTPAAAYAKARADELYKQGFLKLRIETKDLPEDAKVTLDGENVGRGVLNTDINADPGDHMIKVRADGKKDFDKKVELNDKNSPLAVTVALEDAPKPPPNIGGGGRIETPPDQGISTLRMTGLVVGGVGILSGIAAGTMGILTLVFDANAKTIRRREPCLMACQAEADQERNKALGAQTGAILTGIIGGVLIATGVVLFIVGGNKKAEPAKTTLMLVPSASPQLSGGFLTGTF